MNKRLSYSILGVITALTPMSVYATTFSCSGDHPSCEQLGFNQSTQDCKGYKAIKCPFDENALFCGDSSNHNYTGHASGESITCNNRDCDALGYTRTAEECDGKYTRLACPFDDTKFYCGGYNCTQGDILYVDSNNKIGCWKGDDANGKTPIGIMISNEAAIDIEPYYVNDLKVLANASSDEYSTVNAEVLWNQTGSQSGISCVSGQSCNTIPFKEVMVNYGDIYPISKYLGGVTSWPSYKTTTNNNGYFLTGLLAYSGGLNVEHDRFEPACKVTKRAKKKTINNELIEYARPEKMIGYVPFKGSVNPSTNQASVVPPSQAIASISLEDLENTQLYQQAICSCGPCKTCVIDDYGDPMDPHGGQMRWHCEYEHPGIKCNDSITQLAAQDIIGVLKEPQLLLPATNCAADVGRSSEFYEYSCSCTAVKEEENRVPFVALDTVIASQAKSVDSIRSPLLNEMVAKCSDPDSEGTCPANMSTEQLKSYFQEKLFPNSKFTGTPQVNLKAIQRSVSSAAFHCAGKTTGGLKWFLPAPGDIKTLYNDDMMLSAFGNAVDANAKRSLFRKMLSRVITSAVYSSDTNGAAISCPYSKDAADYTYTWDMQMNLLGDYALCVTLIDMNENNLRAPYTGSGAANLCSDPTSGELGTALDRVGFDVEAVALDNAIILEKDSVQ